MVIRVAPLCKHTGDVVKQPWLTLIKIATPNRLHDTSQFFIARQPFGWTIRALARHAINRLGAVAADKEILEPDCLGDLDIRPVPRADRQRSIQRELHIAGAGGLLASGGNLLRQVCSRNNDLGKRDVVVRQKYDIQPAAHIRVAGENLAERVDELDDAFGHVVARRSLGAEDKGARHHVLLRIRLQPPVQRSDMQRVEQLPLVFVQPFDLHVIERIQSDFPAGPRGDDLGQPALVLQFNPEKAVEKRRVLRQWL